MSTLCSILPRLLHSHFTRACGKSTKSGINFYKKSTSARELVFAILQTWILLIIMQQSPINFFRNFHAVIENCYLVERNQIRSNYNVILSHNQTASRISQALFYSTGCRSFINNFAQPISQQNFQHTVISFFSNVTRPNQIRHFFHTLSPFYQDRRRAAYKVSIPRKSQSPLIRAPLWNFLLFLLSFDDMSITYYIDNVKRV